MLMQMRESLLFMNTVKVAVRAEEKKNRKADLYVPGRGRGKEKD